MLADPHSVSSAGGTYGGAISPAERASDRRRNRTTMLLIAMAGSYAILWFPFTLISVIIDLDILYLVSWFILVSFYFFIFRKTALPSLNASISLASWSASCPSVSIHSCTAFWTLTFATSLLTFSTQLSVAHRIADDKASSPEAVLTPLLVLGKLSKFVIVLLDSSWF